MHQRYFGLPSTRLNDTKNEGVNSATLTRTQRTLVAIFHALHHDILQKQASHTSGLLSNIQSFSVPGTGQTN